MRNRDMERERETGTEGGRERESSPLASSIIFFLLMGRRENLKTT
jgi:hypothetical protein